MVVPQKLRDIIDYNFDLDREKMELVMKKFDVEVEKGLKKATHAGAEIKCFVTYVQRLPTGQEVGKFLALDLGGTNFRVLLIHLNGEQEYDFESEIYAIPQNLMVGTGEALFDHIAMCLSDFTKAYNMQGETLPLGFTFSFPCEQVGLTKGNLIKWTKGFNASNVVNRNVVKLLNRSIRKRGDVKILVCAILNDTTGTLMSCAWKNPNCKIGLIIGTGLNACYLEKAENAELFNKPGKTKDEEVILNTECGAFGDHGCLDEIRNSFDRDIDENSLNPRNQLFEKMISGMYMGELVRLVVVELARNCWLFNGKISQKFQTRNEFLTKYVSEIESQAPTTYSATRLILNEMGIRNPSNDDCEILRYICSSVSKRSARLVAAALASLIIRIGDDNITIGVDGSVYRFHPFFHDLMTEGVKELIPASYKFKFVLSVDGSGRGAALVAACATEEELKRLSELP